MSEAAPANDDPRVERSRAAVIAAALELVSERGIDQTSVEAISARSGVAKTTIYRHWPSKPELVLEAIGTVLTPPEDPDTGTLRGDLHELVGTLADAMSTGSMAGLLTTMVDAAERDPEFAALHRRELSGRHRVVTRVIRRGVERGELPGDTDVDEVLALVTGPVFYRRLVTHGRVDHHFAHAVVDRVLTAYQGAPR
jgi:AcrR family transcriptional regulator